MSNRTVRRIGTKNGIGPTSANPATLFAETDPIEEKPYVEEENLNSRRKVTLVDLFAGIGGFHYGIAAAASRRGMGVKPLLVSEIEPSCQKVYRANHRCEVSGDIDEIPLHDFTDQADIVTAGFPCQPFSNSGSKLGLSDPRGQFYTRIEQVIKQFQAKSFILENVPGIRMNGGGRFASKLAMTPQMVGRTMHVLESHLEDLENYTVKWIEIDSSELGSPQVRKRVYIIGVRNEYAQNLEFQFSRYKPKAFIDVIDTKKIRELELSVTQESNLRSFMSEPPTFKNGMRRVGSAYLCEGGNVGQGYHAFGMVPTLTKVWARFLPIYFPHGRENLPKIGEREFEPNSFYGKGYFRRASVREVMRLQGFPDSFEPHENDRLAYEHAGNAVNAKVVRELVESILKTIL